MVYSVEPGIYELSMICALVREEYNKEFTVGGNEVITFVIRYLARIQSMDTCLSL
jgi:hypothetical protein